MVSRPCGEERFGPDRMAGGYEQACRQVLGTGGTVKRLPRKVAHDVQGRMERASKVVRQHTSDFKIS